MFGLIAVSGEELGILQMTLHLGCIADDYTGAGDLANTLVKSGLKTAQLIGQPHCDENLPEVEALVVALKTRTKSVSSAVEETINVLKWLHKRGATQFFFKYCYPLCRTSRYWLNGTFRQPKIFGSN